MQALSEGMAGLGLAERQDSDASAHAPTHSNLYVNNLPHDITEQQVEALFGPYGEVVSLRLVRAPRVGAATKTFAFVKFAAVQQALAAISGLNQTPSGGGLPPLEVKFADADAGERNPELSAPPSDNLYCKNLPGTFTEEDLRALFGAHGAVIECKLLHRGDSTQGAGALVRLGSVPEARAAISALHGTRLPGGVAPLVVRFADSAEMKAKKAARMGLGLGIHGHGHGHGHGHSGPGHSGPGSAHSGGGHGYERWPPGGGPRGGGGGGHGGGPHDWPGGGGHGHGYGGGPGGHGGYRGGGGGPDYRGGGGGGGGGHDYRGGGYGGGPGSDSAGGPGEYMRERGSSVYIKYLPERADKLFLYEKFAPFGAVHSVKVMLDEVTGLCKGVGFVNYCDPDGAHRAVRVMNNAIIGDKRLHVAVQVPRAPAHHGPPAQQHGQGQGHEQH